MCYHGSEKLFTWTSMASYFHGAVSVLGFVPVFSNFALHKGQTALG